MALTEYEQHQQQQLFAEQLLKEDPRLAAKLCSDPVRPGPAHRTAAGGFALLIGSIVLLAGIVAQIPPLGILGFTMMGTGRICCRWASVAIFPGRVQTDAAG